MASQGEGPKDGEKRLRTVDRRRFLKTTGALTSVGLAAGCVGGGVSGGGGSGGGGGGSGGGGGGGSGGGGSTGSSNVETFTNKAGVKVGANFKAVKQLAKNENAVGIYATIETEAMGKWVDDFHKMHPNVKINHTTGGSEDLISRWDSEYKTNNVNGDIYISTSKIKRTWQNGQTMELKPEYFPSFGEAPDKFKSSENLWIATRQVLGSIFYNKEMVDVSAAGSWMDIVTDKRWSDQKIGWDPTPNMFLMSWLFETQGREFFENLKQQRPRFVDSHTDLARFAGAGEFPVSFTYTHKMGEFGEQLPVSYFKWDPLPSVTSPGVINNKANNPNSAILFLNWLTSKEGQQALGKTAYIPWHEGAKYTGYPGVYPSDKYDVDTINPEIDIQKTEEKWSTIMGDLLS